MIFLKKLRLEGFRKNMELKIIRGITGKGSELLEITNENTKFAVGFGEELSTGDLAEKSNPGIDGLTSRYAKFWWTFYT